MKKYLPIGILIFFCACGSVSEEWKEEKSKLFTKVPHEYSNIKFSNVLEETAEHNHIMNDEFITGAGVAVGDINNDGLIDIFFSGNQVNDKLYLNLGDLKFKDISSSAGIGKENRWSTGVSMVDINQDGYLDIYVCRNEWLNNSESGNRLFINNRDLTFTEQSEKYGVADRGYSVQASFSDLDKDGLIDFYLVNQPPSIGNRDGGTISRSLVDNLLSSDKIYKNLNGQFQEGGEFTGTYNFAFGLSATIGDLNNDLHPDIYVANDFDMPDHLYFNYGRMQFKDVINSAVKHISNFSMGTDIADYDNDGNLDIMVLDMVAEDHKRIKTYMGGMNPEDFWTNVNKGWHYQYMFNTLQRNNGNGTFSEVAQMAGVSNTDWSWGPLFADFNNDGLKDLFVTNGVMRNMRHSDLSDKQDAVLDSLSVLAKSEGKKLSDYVDLMEFVEMAPVDKLPNYIFENNGNLTFDNRMEEWGFDEPTLSNGSAYADLDNDGDLDLIINNINEAAGIYRNNSIENQLGNFLRIELASNSFADLIGSRVKLYQKGKFWQMIELSGSRGYMSQSEIIAHFGVGRENLIDKVVVEWNDGMTEELNSVKPNQKIVVKKSRSQQVAITETKSDQPLFKEVTKELKLQIRHIENQYDDYEKEVLLPHKMSEFGPVIAVADVNKDGKDDFYVGGSAGIAASLYLQKNGSFIEATPEAIISDKSAEDAGAVFFDVDNDGDEDLYVASGGNEFEIDSPELLDRLYINDGEGNFKKGILPKIMESSGAVLPVDIDNDSDLDLLIAGRLVPGKYPQKASSHFLINSGGQLREMNVPALNEIGMVTDLDLMDFNGDGFMDIVLVGEWMPITFLINQSGKGLEKFISKDAEGSEGWYYSVKTEDMDNDGDMDIVVGNLGLNYKYKASQHEPFQVHSGDFDQNGSLDIVLSYYEHGHAFPVRGRSCSSQQIPTIKEKFPTFESFGDADLFEVYGEDLNSGEYYLANTFQSYYIENKGADSFTFHPLPMLAQTSSINNILIEDFDQDGYLDILISGNLYQSEIETPRNDAGMGLFMKGDGKGGFTPTQIKESGFFAPHDAKSMEKIKVGSKDIILIGNNKFYLQAIEVQKLNFLSSLE